MRKTTGLTLLFCFVLTANAPVWGCGDKLLHLNRIHRHHAGAESTVLVFARPDSLLANESAQILEHPFRDAGYRLLLVNNDRDLALAVQSGAADVVIADISDAASVGLIPGGTSPLVIPVIAKNYKGDTDAKDYPAKIKWPAKPDRLLDAIDRATDSKWERKNTRLQVASSTTR